MASEPVIRLQNLGQSFGAVNAVQGLSFSVQRGELFGLVGPDGAGKSTTLRMLAGILAPSEGEAWIEGHSISSQTDDLKDCIAYVSQQFGLYSDLTISENIEFYAELYGVPRAGRNERIDELLDFSDMRRFKTRLAGKLSGGMKQKLQLVCALIHTPKVLLLDEPTNGVDPVSRRDFWRILYQLSQQGVTICVSTAYLDEAERMSRLALLHEGQLLAMGTPAEIKALVPQDSEQANTLEDVFIRVVNDQEGHKPSSQPGLKSRQTLVAADRQSAVAVKDLTRRFGSFTAVDRVSFEVSQGEVFGFLGPNGAGKSTTIRMLCGLLRPSDGEGTVSGLDIRSKPEQIKQRIGYMSQKFSLYDDLRVEENIEFFGGIYGLSGARLKDRMAWTIEMAGLKDHRRSLTRTLAVGWKQRLALGCALLHEPPILFLDEPTSGVDPISRRDFWELIYEVAGQGSTVFVTTHYMDEAEYCDRLALIYHGKLIASGSPAELKTEHMQGGLLNVQCDRPQEALELVEVIPGVTDAALFGNGLHIRTPDPASSLPRISEKLSAAGFTVNELTPIQPSLEDVFVALIEETDRKAEQDLSRETGDV